MNIDWTDPDMVSLYERLAGTIQQQLTADLTGDGHVADLAYFGQRAAAAILQRALHVDVMGSSGEWTLTFEADPPPSPSYVIFCATCGVKERELHKRFCPHKGVLRQTAAAVEL